MSSTTPENAFTKPGPHLIIRNFLGDAFVEKMLAFSLAHEPEFHSTFIGAGAQPHIDPHTRLSKRLIDLRELKDELNLLFRPVCDIGVSQLGMSPFEVDRLELELVAHGDGAFYKRHIDTYFKRHNGAQRILSAVYYFHQMPRRFSGGELRFHSIAPVEDGGAVLDVEIERDMLLLFPSWIPHEVRPVSCPDAEFAHSRFAINCWYLRKE